jgi:Host cell surface-exposed lipoprotein
MSTLASSAPAAPAANAPSGATVSQQQALASAQSYLDMGTGFSRAGLIKQLSSPYGDKFSVADATWAVDHSGADWNAQAVMSAKGYMKMGGFSRAGLINQLTSAYGEQFTLAQATYAVNQVGL